MFAVINVEPPGASFYRSQVTEEEMRLCTTGTTADGQPILNYEATYPDVDATGAATVWALEGKGGLPVLNMLQGLDARPLRPERRHRQFRPLGPHREVPCLHLSAGERRQGEPERSQPARALPRVHGGLPRRDGGLERLSGVVPPPGPQAHPLRRGRRVPGELRLGRRGLGGHRQPARRRPHARLPRLRVRGVLPHLPGGGRPGHGRGRPGQLRARGLRPPGHRAGLRRHRPQGEPRLLPGRPLQRAPQLHQRLREVPERAHREGAPHLPPAQPPVALQPQRRQLQLPGRPGNRPGRRLHLRDQLRRVGQPQQERRRRHLPLPLLPALRPGHVGALAQPRRVRARNAAARSRVGDSMPIPST